MTLSELKKLIAPGEGQYIEFKKKADHPEKIVRELVAFANSGGGRLFLGVDDRGKISGLPFPDEDVFVMEAALIQYSKPAFDLEPQRVKVSGREEVLVYSVPSGLPKPYYWLADKEKQTYRAYVRHEDQSLQASREMFQILSTDPTRVLTGSIQFKPLEKKLLRYLEVHHKISLTGLSELAKLPYWLASRKLVYWVRIGLLRIEPGEGADFYYLSPSFSNLD